MKTINKKQLLLTTLLSGATFGAAAAPSFAQEDQIVVTGTRVQRADLESPSPVTSIDAEALSLTNSINAEQFLNSLPQVIPAFDGTSNNPGNGTATVNLRGLGSSRTLVLVDGNRYVSAFGTGIVDLNSIPSSLVKRVDVVTGGASAVYGSDALAGVVNFVLEDEFEGVEVEGSYQSSEKGDAGVKNMAITMGGNFDNGRGNATVHLGYSQRDAVFQGDRDFSSVAFNDTGTGFSPGGSGSVLGTQFRGGFNYEDLGFHTGPTGFNVAAFDAGVQGNGGFVRSDTCATGSSMQDPDRSTIFVTDVNETPALSGDEFCGGTTTFNADGTTTPFTNDTLYNYAPVNYLQLPQERYTMAAFAKYDVTDTVTAKIRGIFTSNNVPSTLAPSPVGAEFAIKTDNPFFSGAERAALVQSAANSLITANRRLAEANILNGDGDATNDVDAAGLAALNAAIAGIDTDADGVADTLNFVGFRRMAEVGPRNSAQEIDSYQLSGGLSGQWSDDWDWDLHAHISRANAVQVQTGNVSVSAYTTAVNNGTCNIFGAGVFSDECVDLVAKTGTIQSTSEQRNIVFTTDGPVNAIQSPAAENPLQLVLGAEYRQENYDFRPDSVLGPDVAGFNQALPVSGVYDSYELFTEVYFPLIEDATYADELSVNGAFRYSDYSSVGGVSSYAMGAEWAPVSDFRFRGQYQRAVRAPNVNDLFSPQSNGFPSATDPCSTGTGSAAICQAEGVSAGAFGGGFQINDQIEGLFGGNPDLSEETSDTYTIGFVAAPSAIPGLTLSADYYDITIEGVIGTVPLGTLLENCYNGVVPEFCDAVTRRSDGSIDIVSLTSVNAALLTSEGIDVEANYKFDADSVGLGFIGGEFGLNMVGGYKISSKYQALAVTDVVECAGFYDQQDCGNPTPEWKHTATLRHSKGSVLNSLRWRYIGGTDEVGKPARFVNSISAKNYFDWTTQWDISDHFQLSGGIVNIFDTDPPILGGCCSEQGNTYPSVYNPFGRQFFVSGKMTF